MPLDLGVDSEHVVQERGREHGLGRTVGDEGAAGEHPQAVGEAGGPAEIVEGRDDGLARLGERPEAGEQVELVAHVEVGRRLVEEQERGVLCEGLRQRDPLLLAARQLRDRAPGEVGHVDGRQRGIDAGAVVRPQAFGPAEVGRAAQGDDLLGGEVDRQLGLLAHQGDLAGALPSGPVADRPAAQGQPPGVGDQPGDGAQQRRLARPVRADEGDPLALADGEREPGQHRASAQRDAEGVGGEHVGHGGQGRGVGGEHHGPLMLRPLLLLPTLLLLAACDSTSATEQRLFEDAALLTPVAGITETDAMATVLRTDASDWRIGPAFLNRVEVSQLPYPNPVRLGQAVNFLVYSQGVPGGLRLYVLELRNGVVDLVPVNDPNAFEPGAAQSGFYPFSVSARQIALGGAGLYRVVLLDGSQNVVTYGDLDIRN